MGSIHAGMGSGQMTFDFGSVAVSSKKRLTLEFIAGTHTISLPVLMVRGSLSGPTLLVSAGVHGDEYEGVRTIFDVFESLDAAAMKGNFLAVPVMNPPAFWNISRTSPPGRSESGSCVPRLGHRNANRSHCVSLRSAYSAAGRFLCRPPQRRCEMRDAYSD